MRDAGHKPRNDGHPQELEEAKSRFTPAAARGGVAERQCFQTPSLQDSETEDFCSFKPPRLCGNFYQQPQEVNTLGVPSITDS